MASKRTAGDELTDRNWDKEEEPEEAGTFKLAEEATLKTRVIKTAKRRAGASCANPIGSSTAFSGFAGFSGFGGATSSKPNVNFSFGDSKSAINLFGSTGPIKSSSQEKDKSEGESVVDSTTSSGNDPKSTNVFTSKVPSFVASSKDSDIESEERLSSSVPSINPVRESASVEEKAKKEQKYLAHVKTLNKSVLAWIQKHVEERPACILTPVFEDYEKHLKRIEEKFGVVSSDNEDSDTERMASKTKSKGESSPKKKDENGDDSSVTREADTFSATKTRFTSTNPSQSTAARGGLDSSLKEIDSKDRSLSESKSDEQPKLSHFDAFSSTKTNHTFSFSNLSHARAPTSSCNSSMKPTFSFCVSGADKTLSNTSTTTVPSNAGVFSFSGSGSGPNFNFGGTSTSAPPSSNAESNKGVFSFGSDAVSSASASTSSAPTFSFGSGTSFSFASSSTSGVFGSGASGSSSTGLFGNPTGTFSSLVSKTNGDATKDVAGAGGDDDEYVPPKPEVKEVGEDDAVFTKRCKLFYKKDNAFVDRGIGNLFIKPIGSEDGEDKKFSLLVRADTNLGNILLNISLTSLKFSKMGSKDISFLCIPNPLPDPKMATDVPVVMLIRVKDSDLRDQVLEKLNAHA